MNWGACIPTRFHTRGPKGTKKGVFCMFILIQATYIFQIYERARQLLMVADRVVAEISYTLSKHIRWYNLLADLQQYNMNESLGENTSLQDLVKKAKTCITSVRLGQGIVNEIIYYH